MRVKQLIKAPLANLWTMRLLELVLNHLEITKDDTVLDVGCGTGFTTFILSKYAKDVVGIDLSEPLIQFLNKGTKPDNVRFLAGGVIKKPPNIFLDTFDKCICIDVLEHVENPLAALGYIHKVLKPEGAAAITFPVNKPGHGRNYFTHEDVCNLFIEAGMKADIKIFKQNWFGSLISSFYRGVQNLFEPLKEADIFDELRAFKMMTRPKKMHALYKLATICLFKISSNSYGEAMNGKRVLVILRKK